MSKSKVDENTLINHYLTACYFKPKEYFVPLPECKRITFYRNLIRAIKRDCTACFKKTIVDTLNDHIAYIEKEKNFKKLLTKDQLKQFEELREDIVMWYAMQKEILKLRLLLDKHSVEVFINDGEKVMTSVFYAPMEADEIIFDTDGIASIDVIKYDICA